MQINPPKRVGDDNFGVLREKPQNEHRKTILSILAGTVFVVPAANGSQALAPFSYTLMVNAVGPAANSLLERSASEILTDEDWRQLKQDVSKLKGSESQVAFGGTSEAERAAGEIRYVAGLGR